jgi:hypothetical protein
VVEHLPNMCIVLGLIPSTSRKQQPNKSDSHESSYRNEEHVIGNWRKGDSYFKVAKNLVQQCSSVLWKVELTCTEIGY